MTQVNAQAMRWGAVVIVSMLGAFVGLEAVGSKNTLAIMATISPLITGGYLAVILGKNTRDTRSTQQETKQDLEQIKHAVNGELEHKVESAVERVMDRRLPAIGTRYAHQFAEVTTRLDTLTDRVDVLTERLDGLVAD